MPVQTFIIVSTVCSLAAWLAVLLLPWGPWRVREVLEDAAREAGDHAPAMDDLTVLIPARNEAALIEETLRALAEQTLQSQNESERLRVIVVDDCSQDGTAEAARRVPGLWLTVLTGQSLPAGWAGKLWALEQGFRQVDTRYTLLLDADIQLEPGVIVDLLNIARGCDRSLVSVMASLPMQNFWEALLTPAFIYFFKMLYPFHLANSPSRRFASAAGGCMLVDTRVLRAIGGFEPIRGALIDDCALAARFKSGGYHTWTGLSRRVISRRRYHGLGDIWDMVARSAFTQLRYSSLLLLATTLALVVLFWAPFLGLLAGKTWTQLIGAGAYLLMTLTYLPTIRFYRLVWLWALALPLSATLYLGMTWSSALRYWRGSRSTWKQRTYN